MCQTATSPDWRLCGFAASKASNPDPRVLSSRLLECIKTMRPRRSLDLVLRLEICFAVTLARASASYGDSEPAKNGLRNSCPLCLRFETLKQKRGAPKKRQATLCTTKIECYIQVPSTCRTDMAQLGMAPFGATCLVLRGPLSLRPKPNQSPKKITSAAANRWTCLCAWLSQFAFAVHVVSPFFGGQKGTISQGLLGECNNVDPG